MDLFYWQSRGVNNETTVLSPSDIMKDLKIDENVISECYTKSFNPPLEDIRNCTTQTNRILNRDMLGYDSNINQPVSFNGNPIRVDDIENYLRDLICATFAKKKLDACVNGGKKVNKDFGTPTALVIVIVAIVILLNFVVYFLCRRYFAKKIHERLDDQEISTRVNYFITNYSQFKENSS
jgi:hypothetical protein